MVACFAIKWCYLSPPPALSLPYQSTVLLIPPLNYAAGGLWRLGEELRGRQLVAALLSFLYLSFFTPEPKLKMHCTENSKWNCAASFPVSSFMILWAIYILPRSAHLFCCSKIVGPEYIGGMYNCSQIHKYGNWERGRAVSFLAIHISDLVCSATEKRTLQNIKTSKQLTEGCLTHCHLTHIS